MHSYTTITDAEILASTKAVLRITNTTEHDPLLNMFIQEALRTIDPLSMYEKRQCMLDIENGQAQLPRGFMRMLALRFVAPDCGENDDPYWVNNCFQYIYSDTKFLNTCGCEANVIGSYQGYWNSMQIVGDHIHFNQPNPATQAELAFYGLNMDANGNLIIYDYYELAARSYAASQFMMMFPESYPQWVYREHQQRWVAQRAKVVGIDQVDKFLKTKREVMLTAKAILTSNLVNY